MEMHVTVCPSSIALDTTCTAGFAGKGAAQVDSGGRDGVLRRAFKGTPTGMLNVLLEAGVLKGDACFGAERGKERGWLAAFSIGLPRLMGDVLRCVFSPPFEELVFGGDGDLHCSCVPGVFSRGDRLGVCGAPQPGVTGGSNMLMSCGVVGREMGCCDWRGVLGGLTLPPPWGRDLEQLLDLGVTRTPWISLVVSSFSHSCARTSSKTGSLSVLAKMSLIKVSDTLPSCDVSMSLVLMAASSGIGSSRAEALTPASTPSGPTTAWLMFSTSFSTKGWFCSSSSSKTKASFGSSGSEELASPELATCLLDGEGPDRRRRLGIRLLRRGE